MKLFEICEQCKTRENCDRRLTQKENVYSDFLSIALRCDSLYEAVQNKMKKSTEVKGI